MSAHIGNACYLIYADDTETEVLGFVLPGAEFTAKRMDGTEVGKGDSVQIAADLLAP